MKPDTGDGRRETGTRKGWVRLLCVLAFSVPSIPSPVSGSWQCPDGAPPPCPGARPTLPILVVTPFENRSRDTADSYIAATISEDLTSALSRAGTVRLLSPRGSRRGAEYVLAGSVLRSERVLRVSARLERAGSSEIVWTTSLDQPISRSTEAADEVAGLVLGHLGVRGPSAGRAPRARPVDPAAWDLYLRGRYHARRRVEAGVQQAVGLFRQAVARDSTFAPAWAGLADALGNALRWRLAVPGVPRDSLLPAMLDASGRALLADSISAEAWITRALALVHVDPTARTATLTALRRAIRLDSLSVGAWTELGYALVESGDTAAAWHAYRHAISLEPGWPEALAGLALGLYWVRQFDSAAVWADSAVAADPAYLRSRQAAGTIALARGQFRAAEAQFSAARAVGPGPERIWALSGLALVAVAGGDSARARSLVRDMEALTDTAAVTLHAAVFIAWACAALGEGDRALDWLARYQPSGDLHFQLHLRRDAPLDVLRSEPRFRRLVGP